MTSAVKELFDQAFLQRLAKQVALSMPQFDQAGFLAALATDNYAELALKQRIHGITRTLHEFLPDDYAEALTILRPVAQAMPNYKYVIFPEFVSRYGLADFALSVDALAWFTRFSTSEFAVRPFIERYPQQMQVQLLNWAAADDAHVRRLASEGCRPRLPWAAYLSAFIEDPSPVFQILEQLRFDDSEYVRKSVANNLNDISKDHPQRVLETAERWLMDPRQNPRLISHALRTLLKQGNQTALKLLGYAEVAHVQLSDFQVSKQLEGEQPLEFAFTLSTNRECLGPLRVEFALLFARQGGRQSRKVFRLSQSDCRSPIKTFNKSFSFKPISTRRYYPGEHGLEVIVNGRLMKAVSFDRT